MPGTKKEKEDPKKKKIGNARTEKLDKLIDGLTTNCCAMTTIATDEDENITSNEDENEDENEDDNKNNNDDDGNARDNGRTEQEPNDNGDIDLDAELANLDIDKDFQLSFVDSDNDDDDDDDGNDHENANNPEFAKTQLSRKEVFSKHYSPTAKEEKVLKDLSAKLLGPGGTLGTPAALMYVLNLSPQQQQSSGSNGAMKSILLKRGPIDFEGATRDLLLFTHGFCITSRPLAEMGKGGFLHRATHLLLSKSYLQCHLYTSVAHVKDLWQLSSSSSFSVKLDGSNGTEFKLDVPKKKDDSDDQDDEEATKREWLHAWEQVLLQRPNHMTAEEREARIVGWQHVLLQTSLYTAAVTGQAFYAPSVVKKQLDTLDTYNRLAPLHYAALHNQVHVIQHLIQQEGADPEVEDDDGRTPMYYAARDNLQPAIMALKECGAAESEALERELHGALVEEARLVEQNRQEQDQRTELFQKTGQQKSWIEKTFAGFDEECVDSVHDKTTTAAAAADAMKDGLNALHVRGAKINDLGDKTQDLENNAAEYKNLAAQVREKLEKQNKGLNFLNPFAK